jgi:hypothetical protein
MIDGYTRGASDTAVSLARARARGTSDQEWAAAVGADLGRAIGDPRFPTFAALLTSPSDGRPRTMDESFEFGLARVLDGIELYVASQHSARDDERAQRQRHGDRQPERALARARRRGVQDDADDRVGDDRPDQPPRGPAPPRQRQPGARGDDGGERGQQRGRPDRGRAHGRREPPRVGAAHRQLAPRRARRERDLERHHDGGECDERARGVGGRSLAGAPPAGI